MEIGIEKQIRDILENFVTTFLPNLECDGGTRFVSAMMDKMSIEHRICLGAVTGKNGDSFSPHYWIESNNNLIWDFTCEKWVGSKMSDCKYILLKEVPKDTFMLKHILNRQQLITMLMEV